MALWFGIGELQENLVPACRNIMGETNQSCALIQDWNVHIWTKNWRDLSMWNSWQLLVQFSALPGGWGEWITSALLSPIPLIGWGTLSIVLSPCKAPLGRSLGCPHSMVEAISLCALCAVVCCATITMGTLPVGPSLDLYLIQHCCWWDYVGLL